MIEKLNFNIKKIEEKYDERELWSQLKIITAMLVFNFSICRDMMMKKPIQSDIYDKPLISKIAYLVFNIKAVMIKIEMKDFVDRKTQTS